MDKVTTESDSSHATLPDVAENFSPPFERHFTAFRQHHAGGISLGNRYQDDALVDGERRLAAGVDVRVSHSSHVAPGLPPYITRHSFSLQPPPPV